jgi:hypothetical protein
MITETGVVDVLGFAASVYLLTITWSSSQVLHSTSLDESKAWGSGSAGTP